MKLRLCPFCGGKIIFKKFRNWFFIYRFTCPKCGMTKETITNEENKEEESKAILSWNKRVK